MHCECVVLVYGCCFLIGLCHFLEFLCIVNLMLVHGCCFLTRLSCFLEFLCIVCILLSVDSWQSVSGMYMLILLMHILFTCC